MRVPTGVKMDGGASVSTALLRQYPDKYQKATKKQAEKQALRGRSWELSFVHERDVDDRHEALRGVALGNRPAVLDTVHLEGERLCTVEQCDQMRAITQSIGVEEI